MSLPEDGYAEAFYEIAKMLGIAAQPLSPREVWETQMRPKLLVALPIAPMGGADIRIMPLTSFASEAKSIVDSAPVIGIWTACEWNELHEDGQQWCQSASKKDPLSASKRDPLCRAV